ncbi:GNAT family N-acetyltransferase [Croceicoccus mobilis]|uniref:Acetyltransferase n=1 Tax=Croceicoccus mobilis TaxID=1703339 RepID=A0A916YYH5_9SPHN|nr:GNAT family N-acetyltransferase [Croceicoccus mobilis]GGD67903.1 acetyltransferase [Croceicoccus mobilis]
MTRLLIRDATLADLPAIIALGEDDPVAVARDPVAVPVSEHEAAFALIEADPGERLLVAEIAGTVIGSFQLSFIPGIARRGTWRGMIESVRVTPTMQGRGIGRLMMLWAIDACRAKGCHTVQLTSATNRPDAHRFYERLGFHPTHRGYKLKL